MSDERVSARLDGEMDPAEARRFDEELEASPELRAELESVGALRAALRALPEEEPTVDLVAEGRRRRRWTRRRRRVLPALAVGAVAAAWLLVLGFGAGTAVPRVVPALDQLVDTHAAAASGVPEGFAEMDVEMMSAGHPESLGHGLDLTSVYARGDLVQLRYSDGEHAVSVFSQRGAVDWDAMPTDGEMEKMDDDMTGWSKSMEGSEVVVIGDGDDVITLIADPGAEPMAEMAMSMMDGDDAPSVAERLRRAAAEVVDLFAFG